MTEDQWAEFWHELDELFPGKLNPTQAGKWKARVLGLSLFEAKTALNYYYADERKPKDGTVPSLIGFLRKVRSDSEERHMKKGGGAVTSNWHGTLREAWKLTEPERAAEFSAMSKDEILLRQAKWEHEESCRVYGKLSRGAASSYWKWQARLYRVGDRDTYPGLPEGGDWWKCMTRWSYGSHILYLEEVGELQEAQSLRAEYRRVGHLAPELHHGNALPPSSPPVTQCP